MTPADELRTAAAKIRDVATRTATTLERHEVDWTDLTISDTTAQTKARPMVWSQYAATMGPAVGVALADWLDSAAEDAEQIGADHRALAVARTINGGEQR